MSNSPGKGFVSCVQDDATRLQKLSFGVSSPKITLINAKRALIMAVWPLLQKVLLMSRFLCFKLRHFVNYTIKDTNLMNFGGKFLRAQALVVLDAGRSVKQKTGYSKYLLIPFQSTWWIHGIRPWWLQDWIWNWLNPTVPDRSKLTRNALLEHK